MTKWLTLVAIAGSLLGCTEEQPAEIDDPSEAETQSEEPGTPQYQIFGGGAAKVTNTGAACTVNTDCKGSAARCLTTIPLVNTPVAGGSCTATCARDSECGPSGGCPLAQIANLAKTFIPDAGALGAEISVCLQKCRADSECHSGRLCQDLPIPSIPFLLTAPTSKFCLPPMAKVVDGGILLPDGGFVSIGDGGLRLPDGGIATIPGLPGLPGGGAFPGIPGISGFPGLPGAGN